MSLNVQNLHVNIEKKEILRGIDLHIPTGEIHAIMGTNGSGKSTLSKVITGHPAYQITKGQILFEDEDITYLEPEERALRGLFLSFQYPIEVPGVSNEEFLRTAYNMQRRHNLKAELNPIEFFNVLNQKCQDVNLNPDFLARNVNEGFSGGEKKRNEVFQLVTLNPKLCILDEIDSGLDIDALKNISNIVNNFVTQNQNKSLLIITHYKRLLDYIKPDVIHVMKDGKIVKTGDFTLADQLENKGYEWLEAISH